MLSPISIGFFNFFGGIENVRIIHHTSAIVMMIVSVFHVLDVLYRVLRVADSDLNDPVDQRCQTCV